MCKCRWCSHTGRVLESTFLALVLMPSLPSMSILTCLRRRTLGHEDPRDVSSLALQLHSSGRSHIIQWPDKHSDGGRRRGAGLAAAAIYYDCAQELCYTQAFGLSPQSNTPHVPLSILRLTHQLSHLCLMRPPPPPPFPPSSHSSVSGWKVQWGCGIPEGQWGREEGVASNQSSLYVQIRCCSLALRIVSSPSRWPQGPG